MDGHGFFAALRPQHWPSRKDIPIQKSAPPGPNPVPAFDGIATALSIHQRHPHPVPTPLGKTLVFSQNGSSLRPPACAAHTLPLTLLALHVRQSNCSTDVR